MSASDDTHATCNQVAGTLETDDKSDPGSDGMIRFALELAAQGRPVFPLHVPEADGRCSCGRDCGRDIGKHPRTLNGLTNATRDLRQIRSWWGMWPDANIGMATGAD